MRDSTLFAGLTDIVGNRHLLTDPESLQRFGLDRTDFWTPKPCAAVLPASVDEVRDIVRLANRHRLAIVPSGGRTGLSGGAVAANGELVLSLQRMDSILEVDTVGRSLRCGAGVVTGHVHQAARENGFYFPVDFASSGSSQIGGNVATNAGGIRVIRYGMMRHWVQGLKVVTGAGDVLDLNRGLIKNNTGLDFRQLFIGSEGILGVICEVTLGLAEPPPPGQVMVFGLPDYDALMALLGEARRQLTLSAFEFFSDNALGHVLARFDLKAPFSQRYPCYGLLEFDRNDDAALSLFRYLQEQGIRADAVISHSDEQVASLWALRENITESLSARQPWKQDIAVPIPVVPDFIRDVGGLIESEYSPLEAVWFGHVGDGNLHLNILKPATWDMEDFVAQCRRLMMSVLEKVQSCGGSISAEHGVGLLKKPFLQYSRESAEVELMRRVKAAFDPAGIMNPGKVLG